MKKAILVLFIMGFLLSLFILYPAFSSENNNLGKKEIKQLVNAYQSGEQLSEKELLSIKGFLEPEKEGNFSYPNYSVLQDTIFEEHFTTGALPAGWQNVANIDTGGVWEFNNPGARTFNSTTSADGFAIFDSDNYGDDGAAEDADLITPPIDCSALSVVTLRFEHYFFAGFGGAGEVFVSGDNGANWTSLDSWGAASTNNAQTEAYDISSIAAGQSQVLVRWNWTGDWSWFWCLDDITLGSFEINAPAPVNPPRALQAETGLEIGLNWLPPLPPGELGYDDDTSEQGFGFGDTGEFAVRFTPNVYPSTLLAIKTYWDSSATTPPLDNDVEYSVWVDSAGSATPDSEVVANTAYTIPYRNDWSEVDISSAGIVINDGDFFYSWAQIDTFNYQLGLDVTGPNAGRAWVSFDGVSWDPLAAYGLPFNLMIRALVQEGAGPNARIVELSPDGSRHEVNLSARNRSNNYAPNKAKFKKPYKDEFFRSAPSISKSTNNHKSSSRASIRALASYNIYRNNVFLASTDSGVTNYNDASVTLGNSYNYYVTALYDEGESRPSNTASATAAAEPLLSLTHTPGDLNAGIFNDGSIGTDNENFIGPGVTWKGQNGLFTGGPIFGTSAVDSVNGLFGSYDIFGDLIDIASNFAGGFTSDANFDQVAEVTVSDIGAPVPYGVDIIQKSYSNTGDNFTFIRYGYVNNSGSDLNDFYAGLVLDWDIGTDAFNNSGGVSKAENLTYQYEVDSDTTYYYGAAALDGLAGWKVTSDPSPGPDIPGITQPRHECFVRISTPDTEPLDPPWDFRSWLGSGPFDIAAGDTQWVTFALVAGDDLDSIRANAAAASEKAQTLGWIRITAPKLLISEIVARPTPGEYVEIYNPNESAVDLSNYYLANSTFQGGNTYYYQVVEGGGGGGSFGDFDARFPDGATIDAGEYQTVAMVGDSLFFATYGVLPTYELYEDSSDFFNDVPNMRDAVPGSIDRDHAANVQFGVLTNGDEDMTLYYWNGATDLVGDVDYAPWDEGDGGLNEQVDKTGVRIDGPDADTDSSEYLPDTPWANQVPAPINNTADGYSTHRIDYTEGNQIPTGGNGVTGANETSEDLNNTFTANSVPSPNGPRIPTSVSLQPIHNAAQATLATIDIYINGALVGDNWDFRTAQPFIPLLSGIPLNIGVAFSNSTTIIRSFSTVLEPGKDYTAVLSGVLTPGLYADNPDGRSIELNFFTTDSARKVSSTPGSVDLQVMNGVTDAPKLDIKVAGTPITLVEDLGYGEFSGYVSLTPPPDIYRLEVTDSSGSTSYGSFDLNLTALMDSAVTVFASGFLDPSANQNGPALGLFAVFPSGNVVELANVVGIKENGNLPTTFAISQNYPNPFNPTTSIKYQLPQTADVTITIYNLLGQKVRTLVNDKKEAGYYKVEWNGLNDHDVQVATGLYIYRIKAADFVRSKKMLLLK